MSRAPSPVAAARALWLLGLRDPADVDEVRLAWKARVAQAHPDRRGDHPEAAHRLTAAFNDARDVLERWAATGRSWPTPSGGVLDEDDSATTPAERRAPREERRTVRGPGLRRGDLVRRAAVPHVPARVVDVRPGSAAGVPVVQLDDGAVVPAAECELAGFACPVCGLCDPSGEDRPARRPCLACLGDLERLERQPTAADAVVQEMAARARTGRERGSEHGDVGLVEHARERSRWVDGVRRRPREERRDALLAAFAHGFAVWGEPLE